MDHKLFIISIAYNDFAALKATYESLRAQTWEDFSWLVVDGASGDGTVEWLETIDDPRLSWRSEQDSGIYHAMNKGIERLEGAEGYVMFLNAGDILASDDVLKFMMFAVGAAEELPKLVYGDSIEIKENGTRIFRPARTIDWIPKGMFTHHQAMLFHFNRNDGTRYRERYQLSADYAFVFEWVQGLRPGQVIKLDREICEFSLDGVSSSRRMEGLKEDFHLRLHVMKRSISFAIWMHVAHYVHHYLKKYGGMFFRRPASRKLN